MDLASASVTAQASSRVAQYVRMSTEHQQYSLESFDESLNPDIIIAARLQPGNEDILDCYSMPRTDILRERVNLKPNSGLI